jgi:predicted dehydrogenase
MIRAGIVGLGKMGISHCSIVNAHPLAKVVAVCDTSSFVLEAFNKYTEMETFTDYKRMIEKARLDCIFIATPTRFHADIVNYALSAGVHSFCEKPFVLITGDGIRLVELAKQKKLVNQVGYHNRFIATFNECKRLIDQKVIGDMYHFVAEAYGPVVVRSKSSTWRSQGAEGGGCLYDYASHVLDLVNFISGAPIKVRGTLLKKIYSYSVEDAVYSTLVLGNGLSGQLSVNWSDESYRKISVQYTAMGTKGKITADAQELKIFLKEKNESAGLEKGWNSRYITNFQKPVDFYLRGEEYSAQIEYFIWHVHDRNLENCNSFENALTTDRVIELLKKDAADNG